MNRKYHFCLIFIFILIPTVSASDKTSWTSKDENLEITIIIEGVNIQEANNRADAIIINPDGQLQSNITIRSLSDTSIELIDFEISAIVADIEVYTSTENLEITLHPNNTLEATQSFELKSYLEFSNVNIISGIYAFKYNLEYTKNANTQNIPGEIFFLKIDGNPLLSVTGAASTVAIVTSSISLLSLANTFRVSGNLDLKESIDSSIAVPSNKLLGLYKGKTYKSFQNEIISAIYGKVASWSKEKCPQCNTEWQNNDENCLECGISREEGEKIYHEKLQHKCIEVCKELVDSVSGKSLYSIAESLSDDIIPTTSIISVLSSSGLSLIKPRVSNRMSERTRSLIFKCISTALLTIFWIQSIGYEAISLTMLIIAIATGSIPAMIVRRLLHNGIRDKVIAALK